MINYSEAYSGFSVKDIDEARTFYKDTLGLEVKDLTEMGATLLQLNLKNGTHILVYPKPNHTPATFTILNFNVSDIDKTVDELTAKNVPFEHYDQEYIRTDEKGISRGDKMSIAWFTDPSGNILSVIEEK
ncbi:MAG: VOC family protein [Mucilaginibacter polytrichastri]|nr:VOC family protein [Mucilaginibacter polytrichastri]